MESIPEILESLLLTLRGDDLEEDKSIKKARHSSGQVIRLLFDAKRTAQGYKAAEVFIGPTRTEQAYVAAVVALIWDKIEPPDDAILLSEHTRLLNTEGASLDDVEHAIKNDPRLKATRFRDLLDSWLHTGQVANLSKLLEYFRPEFGYASEKERMALLKRTIGYVNEYLEALRRLTGFLQYGEAGPYEGLATKQVTQASKQVQAAHLRELVRTERGDPLPYSKIGQLLGEKPAPGQHPRSFDSRISRMVGKGKEILKQALGGEQGYQDYIEAKRAEMEQWQTLSEAEQRKRLTEENSSADLHVTIEVGK